jgi:Spy/CpxP family protein refolding chaperone
MKTSTNKILTFAVILLLLVNVALVIFMLNSKDKHDEKRPNQNGDTFQTTLIKELNMSDQQKQQYQDLRQAHFKNIRPLIDSVRLAKAAFFSLMKDSMVDESTKNTYATRITTIQGDIDKATFAYLVTVRRLFDAGQQIKFDDVLQRTMQRNRRDSTSKK